MYTDNEKGNILKGWLESRTPEQAKAIVKNKTHGAREFVLDHPDVYSNTELVRAAIAKQLGTKKLRGGSDYKKDPMFKDYSYSYREECKEKYTPYILPKSSNNIGLICDPHSPYHDTHALGIIMDYFEEHGINTIIWNGDGWDCFQVSSFEKRGGRMSTLEERDITREMLLKTRKRFPDADMYYKIGNHEDRLERYILRNAKGLEGLLTVEDQLQLASMNIKLIHSKQIMKAGKLNIIHGHEYQGGGGVNPARAMFLKAKGNTIFGHVHQTSEHVEKNIDGDIIACWSVGHVALIAEYAPDPFNKWNQGFAHIEVRKDGTFSVNNKRIINGKIL